MSFNNKMKSNTFFEDFITSIKITLVIALPFIGVVVVHEISTITNIETVIAVKNNHAYFENGKKLNIPEGQRELIKVGGTYEIISNDGNVYVKQDKTDKEAK